jgi:PAS domain S-box-containing protein
MAKNIIQELAANAAILLVLSFLYVQVYRRWESTRLLGQALNGILFGGVAIGVMLTPLYLVPGVVFDTRSVVISVGGLFGGPVVAAITFVMASAFRIWQGGAGALMGVLVSFFSAALGAAYFFWKKHNPKAMTAPYLYGFGLTVHVVMLACALALPGSLTWKVLGDIALPVIIIYPLATLLLCVLIADREARIASDRLLKESEERYRRIVDTAHEGIWAIDAEQATTFVNGRMAEMMGFAQEEMVGHSVNDFIFPEDLPDHERQMRLRREGRYAQYERRLRRKDGSGLWVLISTTPMFEDGLFAGSLAMYTDISERKRSEDVTLARLRLMEAAATQSFSGLLRLTLDEVEALTDSQIGFYHFVEEDQKTLSLQAWSTQTSAAFCQALAQGRHYSIDQAGVWVDCVHERRPVVHNDYAALPHRKGLPPGHAEVRRELVVPIFRRDKIVAILGVGNKPLPYTDSDVDTVNYLADVAWEIVQRKQAEDTWRANETRLQAILEASADPVVVYDASGNTTFVNPAFTRVFGWRPEEIMGQRIPFVPADQRAETAETIRALYESGGSATLHTKRLTKGGELLDIVISAAGIPDPAGNILGMVVNLTDITHTRMLEAQLRQAQKMEAIGTLAGGIAHDFNNILGAIMGYAELAQELAGTGRANAKELEQVLQATERARSLVRQILTFSRKADADMRPLSLNKTVRQALQMLEHSLPKMIEIDTHLALDLQLINADPGQMEQILINLATNAADAMPEGGRLVIETQNIVLGEEYSRRHLEVVAGQYVLLMVSDTGHGIDPDTLEHIFDPFFTTKEVGKGTGLGLSSVYGIVKGHGGQVYCYSEPGMGATFKIYLPAYQAGESPRALETNVPEMFLRGSETILLVDDEQALRDLGSQALEGMGYRVITAATGEEALNIYRQTGSDIDLVVMDLGMPGMGGHKALKAIREINGQAKVVIASGYSANGQVKASLDSGGAGFVAKPYRRLDLLSTIRSVLDGNPRPT